MDAEQSWEFATRAIHAGRRIAPNGGATFKAPFDPLLPEGLPRRRDNDLHCSGDAGTQALEHRIASLEEGSCGFVFSSGAAAYSTILGLLRPGDTLVLMEEVCANHYNFWQNVREHHDLLFSTVDATDPRRVEEAVRPGVKLIWVESPSNPLLQIVDIAELARIAHRNRSLLVVDNTLLGPYYQRPLALGADIVVHHAMRYLSGNADLTGGAFVISHGARYSELRALQDTEGALLAPSDCSQALLGLGTLPIRMREHEKNAMDIATFLLSHPNVQQVYYPGLPGHSRHEVAVKQSNGFGGIVSFLLNGGSSAARELVRHTKLFAASSAIGGTASTIDLPGITSLAALPAHLRKQIGITDGLVRLAAGIEDAADLLQDLENALQPL